MFSRYLGRRGKKDGDVRSLGENGEELDQHGRHLLFSAGTKGT
jgi:hypothetical protein